MSDLQQRFRAAQASAKGLRRKPDDETLLELYSYYKQAEEGDAGGARPGAFDFVARAKYDAWMARKGMSRDNAMKGYIKLVEHLQAMDE
jgi:acyl-CoA-binding protein